MELSERLDRLMFIVNLKTNDISEIFCTHESKTGNTVLTEYGQLLRANTKYQKIFYEYDFARLAIKRNKGETNDSEYSSITERLNLRRSGRCKA